MTRPAMLGQSELVREQRRFVQLHKQVDRVDRATSAGYRLQADFLSLMQQYKEANRTTILDSLPDHDILL